MSFFKGLVNIASKAVKNLPVGSSSLKDSADPTKNSNRPGVYLLLMNGKVMKAGSAEIGVQKRMQQYYGLNPRCGLNKHINESNRDRISIKWQICNLSQCKELESKLFDKYGDDLPWSERRPRVNSNTVKLLI